MRIIFVSFAIIASLVFLNSCSNDSPVNSAPQAGVQWQLVDSIYAHSFDQSFISAENDVYFTNIFNAYRLNNGIRTTVDFQDAAFYPSNGDAYSPDYVVFSGVTNGSRGRLKIFNSGTLATVEIDNTINTYINNVKILQPGKILATSKYKLYNYDNGNITTAAISPDENIYRLVISEAGSVYICAFAGGYADKVYKYENDSLKFIGLESTTYLKMQSNNYLFRVTKNSTAADISFLRGVSWTPLCADNIAQKFFYAAGANLDYVYFTSYDSTTGNMQGSIWNGAQLTKDAGFPLGSEDYFYTSMSTMKDNTFYFTKYIMSRNTTYIYKVKRVS
jgi:hypothetical protein